MFNVLFQLDTLYVIFGGQGRTSEFKVTGGKYCQSAQCDLE